MRRQSALFAPSLLLVMLAVLALGCAEGAPSVSEQADGGDVNDVMDVADTARADTDAAPAGELELCVLNTAGPQGACADPAVLDFGMLTPGNPKTRLFRIDNATAHALQATQTAFDTPSGALSIVVVHYEPDPGAPGSLIRSEPTLPAELGAATSLWFEVTAVPGAQAGPLPASQAIVLLEGGPPETARVEVAMVGEQSGCAMGTGDCDGDASNGCESDLLTSVTHCGGCGAGCNPPSGTGECSGGMCLVTSCEAGRGDCDANSRNGCETDLTRTPAHCGACDVACSNEQGTTSCVESVCVPTCAGNFGDCDGDPGNGCETSLDALDHCGACGQVCAPPEASGLCNADGTCGVAACNAGFGDCDAVADNGCEIDTASEIAHCGACNNLCVNDHGSTSCASGLCVPTCSAGFADCDGNAQNGCETSLDGNPACGSATTLTSVRGDTGSDVTMHSGYGEGWFKINVREDSSGFCSADDLCAVFDLTVPMGTDYNLEVYCDNCTGADNTSSNTGSANESTHVRWDEDTVFGCPSGSDTGRDIYARVSFVDGNTCEPYTLTVRGNQCRSGNTCSSK